MSVAPQGPDARPAREAQLCGHTKAVTSVEVDIALLGGLQVRADPVPVALLQYLSQEG